MSQHPLEKIGHAVAGKKTRWITVAVWVILLAVLGLTLPQVNSLENYAGDELPANMTSIQADDIIAEQFPSDSGIPLLIVWYKEAGLAEEDLTNIQALYKKLEEEPLEGQTTVPPFASLPPQALAASVSENGTSLVTPVFFSEQLNTQKLEHNLEEIRSYTKEVANINPYDTNSLDDDGLHARFSGPVGISVDATSLFESADFKLMVATVIIILAILLVIYRSPILAVIPIIVVSIAFLVISPLLGFMVEQGWIAKDAQAIAIMIVLLFGAGTDYCLFLITKYRDKLLELDNKFEALAQALRDSAGAIAMSGLTVVIGLATLALADYGAFQRFAVPFSFGVFLTMIAVLTLLPAVLSILGRKAFWPFVPRTVEDARAQAEKKNKPYKRVDDNHAKMRKVGTFVTNNSWLVIAVTAITLIGLALVSTQIKYNYDLLSSFPEEMDSREGFAIIEENFTPGELAPVKLVVDTAGSEADLTKDLEKLPYVGLVKEPAVGEKDANIVLYEIDLDKDPYSNAAMDDIEDLKEQLPQLLADNGLEGAEFWVGGET
ncbi:MAG: MMPL family transporter, partial [Lysinibacillus sp.]